MIIIKNVYVAGNFNNKELVNRAQNALREIGVKITYDWTKNEPTKDEKILREYAHADTYGVLMSDAVVYMARGRFGSHAELGMGIIIGKRVFIVGDTGPDECVFYYHANVKRFKDIEELVAHIRNPLSERKIDV